MKSTDALSIAAVLAAVCLAGCREAPPKTATHIDNAPATFVGRSTCTECHAAEADSWRGSHHDLAMQEPNAATVRGNFDDTVFEHSSTHQGKSHTVTSHFTRRDDGFFVRTEGVGGEPTNYRVAYTFGVEPLQQYLVETGAPGALQALPIAWDTRPADAGGQRWLHVYEDPPAHDDPLHWTGPQQNWNHMCADCHSTGLVKGYDAQEQAFDTTWEEINVSCEACHGPGSQHVAAARAGATDGSGLVTLLKRSGRWTFADGATTAHLIDAEPQASSAQIDACGRCHARRAPIAPFEHGDDMHGGDLHDAFSVTLLEDPLYYPDGQIRDEVYVYGSFLQSRMHTAGVACSDCHEPHSARLRLEGNALCTQCHAGNAYDVTEHHHHPVGGEGTACIDCHMPARDYMRVDPRRDHSFRVPRPDLSQQLATPNACTGCHVDQGDDWAADAVASWGAEPGFHYGEALHAARTWQADAEALLLQVIEDPAQPAIVRASALTALVPYLSPASLPAVERALVDEHPLVRGGALAALEGAVPEAQRGLAEPLLADSVRTVRDRAARLLAWTAISGAPEAAASTLPAALDEVRSSLAWRADRPDSYLHLGDLEVRSGDDTAAEAAYRQALARSPFLTAAAINLADVYRATGRDPQAETLLRQVLERSPDDAGLHQALGLTLIRLGRSDEALKELRQAYQLAPDEPRFAYIYGVATHDLKGPAAGLRILTEAQRKFPGERQLTAGVQALVAASRTTGK